MAAVQIWFHSGFVTGNSSDTALPKEPPVGYSAPTVGATSEEVAVPGFATIAVIETDADVAYRVGAAAVAADCPVIAATANKRYVVAVSNASPINFITTA